MNSERVLISLTPELKDYLDELREEGFTIAGYVRGLLERDRQDWREYQERQKPQTSKSGGHRSRKAVNAIG